MVIISTSRDFERGSLLTLPLLRLDQAELSNQVDKDLCSALGKLSSRNKKSPGEQRQHHAKKKKTLQNNKTTPKASEKKSVMGDCQLHSRLPGSLRVFQQSRWKSCSIISSSLISSAGEEWILTCKRLSTMGNKLIISNQIFHIARGGGELISDRSRISSLPVNTSARAGKRAHTPTHTHIVLLAPLPDSRAQECIYLSYTMQIQFQFQIILHEPINGAGFYLSITSLNKACTAPLNKVHCLAHSTSFHLCN